MNLFPTENYFTAATKRVIPSMQSCTKKISKRKGKDSGEIVLYPVDIDEHCSWNLIMHAYFFRCMQILLQTTPDSVASFILCFSLLPGNSADIFKDINIYTHIHIYKYIFRSNSRGLAPLGRARPDKFINPATLGPSALASRGMKSAVHDVI